MIRRHWSSLILFCLVIVLTGAQGLPLAAQDLDNPSADTAPTTTVVEEEEAEEEAVEFEVDEQMVAAETALEEPQPDESNGLDGGSHHTYLPLVETGAEAQLNTDDAVNAAAIPPSPAPTYSFDTGTGTNNINIGGSPADANIAASSTHVCVTARAAFACYTKAGAVVAPGPGFATKPTTASAFFTKLGITLNPTLAGTPTKDGRVVFDPVRKRFFMVFQSREEHPRLLIAVSKSQDPRDGWWAFADNVENAATNGHDYLWIGVNASHFLVSSIMHKCTGTFPTSWVCSAVGTRHFLYTAANLTTGQPYTRSEWSHSSANGAVPCTHDSSTTDAFWIHRDDSTHVSVWAVRNGQVSHRQVTVLSSTNAVNGQQLGGQPVSYTNIGRAPQNCEYRNGRIVYVSNDGHTWSGQSSPNNAVRLVRLNVAQYFNTSLPVTVELDRIFGRAALDDPAGMIFDYGWPAVATNANGDIVIGSVRSHATVYPELRASVWFNGQPDISPSASLVKSVSPLTQFHMAGAGADPSTSGVYLAQQVGVAPSGWRIRVVKVLGAVQPDVIATQIQAPGTVQHGKVATATITIVNQGDGAMPASQADLRLSNTSLINAATSPVLATFSVPALAPNQVVTLVVPFPISAHQPAGTYYIGVVLDSTNSANEFSEINNLNPFLVGAHGNWRIIVT